jgi:hypothetical protein
LSTATSLSASTGRTRPARREAAKAPSRATASPPAAASSSGSTAGSARKPAGAAPWPRSQGDARGHREAEPAARDRRRDGDHHGLAQHQRPDLTGRGADRAQHRRLLAALRDGEGEGRGDHEDRDEAGHRGHEADQLVQRGRAGQRVLAHGGVEQHPGGGHHRDAERQGDEGAEEGQPAPPQGGGGDREQEPEAVHQ